MTSASASLARLKRGLGAHGVMQLSQLGMKLLEAPLFLVFWGAEGYGYWLLITALPNALALTDGGFTKAAQREMVMRAGRDDQAGVKQTYQSAWILLVAISIVALAGSALLCTTLPLETWLNIPVPHRTLALSLIILMLQIVTNFQVGLLKAVFFARGQYATAELYTVGAYILSFTGMAICIALGGKLLAACMGYSGGFIIGYALMAIVCISRNPEMRYGMSNSSTSEMRSLVRPSLANLAFPIGDAANMQGTRLVIGTMIGAQALASFSTIRTLTRMALQPILAVGRTVEPEVSLSHGSQDEAKIRRIFFSSSKIAIFGSLVLGAILTCIAPYFYATWTHGKLLFDYAIYLPLLASSFFNANSNIANIIPCAMNRHARLPLLYLIVYGPICVILVFLMTKMLSVQGASLAILISDILMFAISTKFALMVTRTTPRDWILNVMRFPNKTQKAPAR